EDGKPIFQHEALGPDGLAEVGVEIQSGQTYINKCVPTNATESVVGGQPTINQQQQHRETPVNYRAPVPSVVDQ
ncbi:hypothetical protein WICPIJ_002443, partial [Wickerhamomyces pijperi]